jgi:putative transposase
MPHANRYFVPGLVWHLTHSYHATAIETDARLLRCLAYIDLNMFRAGVVQHPSDWEHGRYGEIQQPPERFRLIDLAVLTKLCGFTNIKDFQAAHRQWVETAPISGAATRDERWSESIAVGSEQFVENVKAELGVTVRHRNITAQDETYALREPHWPYDTVFEDDIEALSQDNTHFWDAIVESTRT